MKAETTSIHLRDYALVIQPHDELRQRVFSLREQFHKRYSLEFQPSSRVHLPLIYFRQHDLSLDKVLRRLHFIAMGYHPFKIDLQDYDSSPAHSIFIDVKTKVGLQDLVKHLRSETHHIIKLSDDIKPFYVTEPNIMIASKLKPWQYEQGWKEFSHRNFHASFIADSILLLRKSNDEKKYLPVQRFALMNLPVATKQGNLFM